MTDESKACARVQTMKSEGNGSSTDVFSKKDNPVRAAAAPTPACVHTCCVRANSIASVARAVSLA
jgi:hypothetical protein